MVPSWLLRFPPVILTGLATACFDGWVDPGTKCKITKVSYYWDEYIADVDIEEPDRCPYRIDQGRTKAQTYFGVVLGRSPGGAGAGDYIETRVFNSSSRNVGLNDNFSSFFGFPPKAEGFVNYTAGTGSYGTATTNYDDAENVLRGFGGGLIAEAEARLTINYEVSSNILAPVSAAAGSQFSVSSSASNYRSPIKYRWWRNGTLMTGVTWSSFTAVAPSAGSNVTYKVEMTDADGDKGTDVHTISAYPGGGGGGGGGGGCLILKPTDSLTDNALPCPPPN